MRFSVVYIPLLSALAVKVSFLTYHTSYKAKGSYDDVSGLAACEYQE